MKALQSRKTQRRSFHNTRSHNKDPEELDGVSNDDDSYQEQLFDDTPGVCCRLVCSLTKEKMVLHGGFPSVPTGLIWPTLSLRIRVPPGRVLKPVVLGIAIHCEWRWVRALHIKDWF